MKDSEVEAVARALWRSREMGFPERVRRMKWDAMDEASGAVEMIRRDARAAIAALDQARAA